MTGTRFGCFAGGFAFVVVVAFVLFECSVQSTPMDDPAAQCALALSKSQDLGVLPRQASVAGQPEGNGRCVASQEGVYYQIRYRVICRAFEKNCVELDTIVKEDGNVLYVKRR